MCSAVLASWRRNASTSANAARIDRISALTASSVLCSAASRACAASSEARACFSSSRAIASCSRSPRVLTDSSLIGSRFMRRVETNARRATASGLAGCSYQGAKKP